MPTKIKRTYGSVDEIDETFRPLFIEKDGKQVLDIEIEGLVPASKVDEFRTTNTRLKEEHEEAMRKFEGIDPDEYRDLKGRAKDLEDGKLVKRGELEPIRQAAIAEAIKPYQQKEREWKDKEATYQTRLRDAIIGSKVIDIAIPFGLEKGAGVALKRFALDIFDIDDDGKEVAKNPDGSPRYHNGDPYTLEQFVKDMSASDEGKFMFKDNAGGGGEPRFGRGGAGGGYNGANPFQRGETWDPQKQSDIMRTDFALAQRLAQKAGVTLKQPVSFVPAK